MPSLLIVDDLPAIHEMLTGLISSSGYLCAGASSGEEAIMRYGQSRFDIILIDYAMEPMNGVELSKRLLEINPNAVIILMSGFANEELGAQAREAGVYRVIEKPIQVDSLMMAIDQAYDEARTRRPLLKEGEIKNLPTLAEHLQQAEENYIGYVLDLCDGDREKASTLLDYELA